MLGMERNRLSCSGRSPRSQKDDATISARPLEDALLPVHTTWKLRAFDDPTGTISHHPSQPESDSGVTR